MKIPDLFEQFLSRIEPTKVVRDTAISAHTTLRERLADDPAFKPIHVDTFLAGSYRRRTAIQPIKDTDIIVITNLDHTIEANTPQKVLSRLKSVLDKYYKDGQTPKTSSQRRSIRIDLSAISMDIIPAVAPWGPEKQLLIPDRVQKEWIPTHPKAHIAWATDRNNATKDDPADDSERGRFVPAVKMMKWLKKAQLETARHPKGFLIECVTGYHQDIRAREWEDVVIGFLTRLTAAYPGYSDTSPAPNVPDPGLPGRNIKSGLTSADFKRFLDVAQSCLATAWAARDAKTARESAQLWQKVFGSRFSLPGEDDDKNGGRAQGPKLPSATAVITGSPRTVREAPPFG